MVLVVDDDPTFLLRSEQILTPEQSVMLAADAKHALELLSLVGPDEFCAALVDIDLTDERGLDVLTRLHRKFPELRMIAVGDSISQAAIERAKCNGAIEVLVKPITREWRSVLRAICSEEVSFVNQKSRLGLQ